MTTKKHRWRRIMGHWVWSILFSIYFVWLAHHFDSILLSILAGITIAIAIQGLLEKLTKHLGA